MRLDWHDELAPLRAEWSELARASGNIFATPEFLELWWEHFGSGRPIVAAFRDEGGALTGLVPLYRGSLARLPALRLFGHGAGDQLGPIGGGPELLARALDEAPVRAQVFLGEQLPGGEQWPGRVLSREGSPVLRFPDGSWDDYLAGRSKNFREQVRRRERKLFREHDCRYELVEDAAQLPGALDVLFRLHGARWEGGTEFERRRSFHERFAAVALDRGWLRLWLLHADGAPRAAWLGYCFEGAESYYQAGRDPAWEQENVGFVLLAHTIRSAREDGMREYRFLRGGEAFKHRFADEDDGLVTTIAGLSAPGRAAAAGAPLALAARRALRRS